MPTAQFAVHHQDGGAKSTELDSSSLACNAATLSARCRLTSCCVKFCSTSSGRLPRKASCLGIGELLDGTGALDIALQAALPNWAT